MWAKDASQFKEKDLLTHMEWRWKQLNCYFPNYMLITHTHTHTFSGKQSEHSFQKTLSWKWAFGHLSDYFIHLVYTLVRLPGVLRGTCKCWANCLKLAITDKLTNCLNACFLSLIQFQHEFASWSALMVVELSVSVQSIASKSTVKCCRHPNTYDFGRYY